MNFRPSTLALVALGLALFSGPTARANELRFSTTAPGGITATGNTLGLSKDTGVNGPGVRDSIGTFVSLESTVDETPANPANPYPQGTTADWHGNGSAATLDLPSGGTEAPPVEVLYAELLWGGSFALGGEDVSADLETSVTLTAGGASIQVAPTPLTSLTLDGIALSGFPISYYLRSADVTAFVQTHRGGEYEVRGVPATQTDAINSLNAAGWTLVVAYRNDADPLRNLTIFVGGSFVDEDTQEDYSVSGFCAPPSGTIFGTAAISAIEGDANLVGDQLLIAPAVDGAFVPLEGPNNPANNFFCSQMNGADGELDASGTFGLANHDAFAGTNIAGGRQGWDVTTVGLSSLEGHLIPGQQSAVLRTITTGDSYVPTLAAFQIDVNAPNLTTSTIEPDRSGVDTGDLLVVTATAENTGLADASSLRFQLAIPDGLALERFTSDGIEGDITGAAVSAVALEAGVDEGDLGPAQTRTVVVELRVTGPGSFFVQPIWSYEYVTCEGTAPESETYSQGVFVSFTGDEGGEGEGEGEEGEGEEGEGEEGEGEGNEGEGEGNEGEGEGNEGEGEGNEGEGAGTEGEGEGGAPEGCGCSADGESSVAGAALSLLALAALGRRARSAHSGSKR